MSDSNKDSLVGRQVIDNLRRGDLGGFGESCIIRGAAEYGHAICVQHIETGDCLGFNLILEKTLGESGHSSSTERGIEHAVLWEGGGMDYTPPHLVYSQLWNLRQ